MLHTNTYHLLNWVKALILQKASSFHSSRVAKAHADDAWMPPHQVSLSMMKMLKAAGCIHVTLTEPCCEICISKLKNSSINPWLTSQAVTVYSNILTVWAHQSTFSSSTYIWSLLPLGSRALLFGLCFQFKLHIPPFQTLSRPQEFWQRWMHHVAPCARGRVWEHKRVHLFGATIFTSTHLHSMYSSRCTSVQNSGLEIRELQNEEDIAMKQSWHVINDTLSFFFTTTNMLALPLPTNTSHHYLIPDSYLHLLFIHYLQCMNQTLTEQFRAHSV